MVYFLIVFYFFFVDFKIEYWCSERLFLWWNDKIGLVIYYGNEEIFLDFMKILGGKKKIKIKKRIK